MRVSSLRTQAAMLGSVVRLVWLFEKSTPSLGLERAKTVSLAPLGCCDSSARVLADRDFPHSDVRSRRSSRSRSRNRRRRQGSNSPRRSRSPCSRAATRLPEPFLFVFSLHEVLGDKTPRLLFRENTPSPGLELAKTVSLAPLGCCDLSARPLSERDFSHSTIRSRHSSRSRSRNRRRRQGSNLGQPR